MRSCLIKNCTFWRFFIVLAQVVGKIIKISGPLVIASNMENANLFDVVRVGRMGLIGEIIEMHFTNASIQVYEDTTGLCPGEDVVSTMQPMSIELGPGLVGNVFDGIGRPLYSLKAKSGEKLLKGVFCPTLSREKKWNFRAIVEVGDVLKPGEIIGEVVETLAIVHKILLRPGFSGKVIKIVSGEFSVEDEICQIKTTNGEIESVKLMQNFPVRKARPVLKKHALFEPIVTGQRIIDLLFPLAKGGVAAVPGPFGSGKTIVQHQLSKWSNVDLVVYIGCGERGNEIADVLNEFSNIINPKTHRSLMDKTILIANTSDMPVAAREASIYTGVTIAEYFRDMGYDVALMADSTSRWAEALREISGRLQEMPGEEGYPAYLHSRLAEFYERAGSVTTLCGKKASLSLVGAVSPPGGDISEPVSQATLRIVKVFWSLDSNLAYRRHFPAINWLKSYSIYFDEIAEWFENYVSSDWTVLRLKFMELLQNEAEIEEIVKLIGINSISKIDRIKLDTAKIIREDFLHQNAFHEQDSFSSLKKQILLMKLIDKYYVLATSTVERGVDLKQVIEIKSKQDLARFKFLSDDEIELKFNEIVIAMELEFENLAKGE